MYGIDKSQALILLGSVPEAKYLDPATTPEGASGYAGHLYSGLVRLNPQMQVIPDLAESWQISADGTVYTFTLRENITFASGSPLTAQDVKDSWERAADPQTGSETVRTYLNDIAGLTDRLDGKADQIRGVQVVDPRTLVVTLDGPKPYFLAKLTYPTSFIVDKADIEKSPANWMFHPNSSGPYTIKENKKGVDLIFERNDNYHTPAIMPYVIYQVNRSGNTVSIFKAGEADITYISNSDARLIQQPNNKLHDQMQSITSMCINNVFFNNTTPPLDDINVRKALAMSIDRAYLHELIFDNMDRIADSYLPQSMPGYISGQPVPPYDPEAARAALKASKYAGEMPPLTITMSGYPGSRSRMIDAITSMWRKELGLQVHLQIIDPDVFNKTIHEKPAQIRYMGWCADYPDPQNFLDVLFHTGNDFNEVGYSNPQVDDLLDQANVEPDTQKRLELYQQAEKLLMEDYAALPMFNGKDYYLVNPAVQNLTMPPMNLAYVDLIYK